MCKPPFANFYRGAIGAIDGASERRQWQAVRRPARAADRSTISSTAMRQNKIDGWQGPPGRFVYLVLRSDAVDVVYGTMAGYAGLGIPYMAHIAPKKRW